MEGKKDKEEGEQERRRGGGVGCKNNKFKE